MPDLIAHHQHVRLHGTIAGAVPDVDAQGLEAAMAMEDRQQSLTAMTSDCKEAQRAFFEKRAPELARAVDETVRHGRRITNREIEIQVPSIDGLEPATGSDRGEEKDSVSSAAASTASEGPGNVASSPSPVDLMRFPECPSTM